MKILAIILGTIGFTCGALSLNPQATVWAMACVILVINYME